MSITIITGQTGAGKSHYAIDTCRLALAADKSVCYITPIETGDHFGHDTSIAALFKLTESDSALRLQAPIPLDEIDLDGIHHVVLDEVHFNPAGAHRFLGSIESGRATVEFSTGGLIDLAQRCAGQACSLMCITQELPASLHRALDLLREDLNVNIIQFNPSQRLHSHKAA